MVYSDRPFRRILTPLDDSSCAQRALLHALSLAHAFRAEVHLLHVIEHPDMERLDDDARVPPALAAVEQAANQYLIARSKEDCDLEAAVQCRTRRAPTAAAGIVQEAAAASADLIVIGARGRDGAEPVEIGRTAGKVVRQAPCPVLIIGPICGRAPEFTQRILVPVDFSAASIRALRLADAVARGLDAELLVLHVVEPLTHPLLLRHDRSQGEAPRAPITPDRVRERLDALIRDEDITVPYRVLTACGRSADGILIQTHRYDAHLIVQGAQGRTAHAGASLGGVAAEVVRRTARPVITVKDAPHAPRTADSAAATTRPLVPEDTS